MESRTCYKTQRGNREEFLFGRFLLRLDYSETGSFDSTDRDARILTVDQLLGYPGIGKPDLEDL